MASTVLKDRIANWPEGQVDKGIQKPTHQSDIKEVRLLERIFKCDHPVAVRSILALVALAGIDPRFGCGFDAMSFLPFMPWHFLYLLPTPTGTRFISSDLQSHISCSPHRSVRFFIMDANE